jgi:hypothetical protein
MSTTPKTITKHILAVLGWPTRISDKYARAEAILAKMTGNPDFPSPVPALSVVQTHINALKASMTAAATRGQGLVAQRNVDLEVVKKDMQGLTLYVQNIADASPDKAVQLIGSAGLTAKKHSPKVKPDLSVANGNDPGTAILVGRGAGSRSAHEWQMSKDQLTWTDLPTTMTAKTSITGLTYGATVFFRHRTVTVAGNSVWTSPVGILVK